MTKEVVIPEKSKEKALRAPLEFIRNIWGSSAGAGSGDFHVYRGVRRREYARQKFIKEMAEKEEADLAYKKSLEQHKVEAEQRTAKKRAKRLKKKEKLKAKKMKKKNGSDVKDKSESETDSDGSQSGDNSDTGKPFIEGNSCHAVAQSSHDEKAQSSQDDETSRDRTQQDSSVDASEDGSCCGVAQSSEGWDAQSNQDGEASRDRSLQGSPQRNVDNETRCEDDSNAEMS